ncbi:MAG: hypothetical protein QN162_15150 [Armatimonadota bacterium]|nr:hypothetical protein [Armatimonadota bacterium]
MALTIRLRKEGSYWVSPARLYLTADGRVVPEGDPDAAYLLVPEGGVLSLEDAERYGLLEQDEKLREPPADKRRRAARNK